MEVVVPDLGDFSNVEIVDVLVKPGDKVKPEDPLITLETEKATMDVPSPAAGRVKELKIAVGDRVSAGDPIMSLEPDGEDQPEGDGASGAGRAARPGRVEQPGTETGTASSQPASTPAPETAGAQPHPATGGGEPRVIAVPDLGDFADVEVVDVLVKPGDSVAAEQGLITLETEKATMDVPTPEAGTVLEVKVAVGDRVSTGDPVIVLRPAPGTAATRAAPEAAAPEPAPAAPQPPPAPQPPAAPRAAAPEASVERIRPTDTALIDEASFARAHASPSVRKLARELGVDLGRVRGSGRKGRVTSDDVKAYVKNIMREVGGGRGTALPSVPVVDFAKFGPVEVQPLTRIQRVSGPRLHASWVNIPHVTQHDEADITELEETRASLKEQAAARGIKLTPLAFVIRACVLVLEEFPLFKSSLAPDGQSVVMKRYTHIGFAVDTPNGLVVPVIRDADKKDLYEIAAALAELSDRAREGKLKPDDIQGGVFSVSSLGSIGGRFFTPIINAPEVAILGVSRSSWQPVYRDGQFVPRLILPLSLSYDHRVIDGAVAVRFTKRLAEVLADVPRLLEAIP
ncbi:MAG TPA: dihydrolipoyllysine-residue acetyltransferase [Gammaproteobacteria bacterium]